MQPECQTTNQSDAKAADNAKHKDIFSWLWLNRSAEYYRVYEPVWCGIRTRLQCDYLGSFVDFVLVASLVNKHGSGLSILEHRRVHGESGGQREEGLLQRAAPHRAALRAHGRARPRTWRGNVRGAEGSEEDVKHARQT